MLISSIVIKLVRKGASVAPDYSLTIHGNGTIIYNGIENVKAKGEIEKTIDEKRVISVLSEFKNINFFSLDDVYPVNNASNRPYTLLSILIPNEDGTTKTKSVLHYFGSKNVPKKLIELEDKIEEIVDSDKWVGTAEEKFSKLYSEPIKETKAVENVAKIPVQKSKSLPVKPIVGVISIFIVFLLLLFAFYSGIISLPIENNKKSNSNKSIGPKITVFLPTNNTAVKDDYYTKYSFELGDNIYIYQEYNSIIVDENNESDFMMEINVTSIGGEQVYSSNITLNQIGDCCFIWNISTNESWLLGDYLVSLTLVDNILEKSVSSQTNFTLSERTPKIIVLLTASIVYAYQDYIEKNVFEIGDKVYVYQEYFDIKTINDTVCDIYLNLTVEMNDTMMFSNELNKSEVKNMAHLWWFTTNDTWATGNYTITSYLYDYNSRESVNKKIIFRIE